MSRPAEYLPILATRLMILVAEADEPHWKISNALGMDSKVISNWIHGIHIPDAYSLFLLALYFDVSVDWMLGLSDSRQLVTPDAGVEDRIDRQHRRLPVMSTRLTELVAEAEKHWTRRELSGRLGVGRKVLFPWMCGRHLPNAYNLRRLAKYFMVSADWLLGLTDQKRR